MEIAEAIEQGIKKLAELSFEGRFISNNFNISIKPTNHYQRCFVCGVVLQMGDRIVKEIYGATSRGYFKYSYCHLDCYFAMLFHTILGLEGGQQ